jgi:hypothetical protein
MIENVGTGMAAPVAAPARDGQATPRTEALFANLVVFFSFFPFFKYLPLGVVETQPVGAIVALIGLLLFGMSTHPAARAFLALVALLLALATVSVFGMSVPAGRVASQLAAYVAPILTMIYLWSRLSLVSVRVVMFCGIAYLGFGLLQYLGLVPGIVEQLLAAIQPRYQSETVGGGRGVVMFAPEPSYAAKQILLFMAFLIAFWRDRRLSARIAAILLPACLLGMIFLNRSVIGIGLSITMTGMFFFFLAGSRMRILILLALVFSYSFGFSALQRVDVSSVTQASPRIVQVAVGFSQEIARGSFGLADLILFGSARIITNFAGARSITESGLLGVGIGNADATVQFAMENDSILRDIPFDTSVFFTLKPQSWIVCYLLETGLVGLIGLVLAMLPLFWAAHAGDRAAGAVSAALISASVIQLLVLGPHSLPVAWLMLLLAADRTRPTSPAFDER